MWKIRGFNYKTTFQYKMTDVFKFQHFHITMRIRCMRVCWKIFVSFLIAIAPIQFYL